MCDECAQHNVDCIELLIARATPDQIRRLLRDIRNGPSKGSST